MPAATTHVEFAKDVYNSLPSSLQEKITNFSMFYLGAQGPDLFFFSGAGVFPHTLKKLGNLMHESKPKEAMQYMREKCAEDKDLTSYYYGFVCHYSLDSEAHPLVFYDAKYLGNKEESETINHFRIEATIDAYILNKKERTIQTYDVHDAVKVSDTDTVKIAAMYKGLFKTIYSQEVDFLKIQKACKECSRYLKTLRPTSNKKFKLFHSLENLLHQEHYVSSLMLFNDFENKNELLNIDHHTYFNTFNESITYTTSFDDCYNNGIKKALRIMENPNNAEEYLLDFDGRPIERDIA